MSTYDPRLIKRIGLAVEMADGELVTLYSESPGVQMQIEKHVETEQIHDALDTRRVIVDSSTDITITGIRELDLNSLATKATAQAIENAKKITGGNPDDYR